MLCTEASRRQSVTSSGFSRFRFIQLPQVLFSMDSVILDTTATLAAVGWDGILNRKKC